MTSLIPKSVEDLFEEAIDLTASERDVFLHRHCSHDPQTRDAVSKLLSAADQAENYFGDLGERLGLRSVLEGDLELPRDRMIGPYRLIRLIGRGGMAAVYLAERDDDQFEQQVALKILPVGFGEEMTRERFLVERQILARLAHPHIARLLDGGVSGAGTPYFAMEYVDGLPIDDHCNELRLGVDARLDLFDQVTEAVAYAHRNLIVHRDLKPANVLVNSAGAVKLVDFGIAKLLEPISEHSQLTKPGGRPLTLLYASPESIRGEPITTATDVYSLGVLLYELLTGRPPFVGRDEGDVRHKILDGSLTPPSKAEPLSGRSEVSVEIASNELRGDLDTIVLTALRTDPESRYQSVAEFSADLERYRTHQPILARPPSVSYRLRKFVRRRRGAVFAGGAVLVLLATIAIMTTRFAITTQRQAALIAKERDTAVQIRDFLVGTFASSNPNETAGETVTARELLDQGVDRIDADLIDQPKLRAVMLTTFGDVYDSLSLYSRARTQYEKALIATEEVSGDASAAYADALVKLAGITDRMGEYEQTLDLASRGIRLSRALGDELAVADNLYLQGLSLQRLGKTQEAEAPHREALEIWRRHVDGPHPEIAANLAALAYVHQSNDELEKAAELSRQALAMRRLLLGDEHLDLIESLYGSGVIARQQGRLESARELYQEALDIANKLNPGGSADSAFLYNGLGLVFRDQDDMESAVEHFRLSAESWEAFLDSEHPNVGFALANLGEALIEMGQADQAVATLQRSLSIMAAAIPDHPAKFGVMINLGTALANQRSFESAENQLLAGYEGLLALHGPDAKSVQNARPRLQMLYQQWNRPDKAAEFAQE